VSIHNKQYRPDPNAKRNTEADNAKTRAAAAEVNAAARNKSMPKATELAKRLGHGKK
jgi:hypothetical protein